MWWLLVYRRFGETCCLHFQGGRSQQVSPKNSYPPDYRVTLHKAVILVLTVVTALKIHKYVCNNKIRKPSGVITLSSPARFVPAGVACVHVLRRARTGWHTRTVQKLPSRESATLIQCPTLRLPVKTECCLWHIAHSLSNLVSTCSSRTVVSCMSS
jgi:hypothetical protein